MKFVRLHEAAKESTFQASGCPPGWSKDNAAGR